MNPAIDNIFSVVKRHGGALLAVSLWGMSFVSTKVVMVQGGLNPTEAYIYRFLLAYVIIAIFSHKQLLSHNWVDEGLMALCGMLSGSIYFILENTALNLTLASNVSLLTSTSPLITLLIVGLFYRSDRPGRGVFFGSMIAFVGMGCVIFNSSNSLEIKPLGDMLAILAAVCWAVYSILLKRLNVVYDSLFITRKTFFYGILTALPFLLFEQTHTSPLVIFTDSTVFVNILFLALGASCLGFYMWNVAVKNLGAVVANNYMYFQPVITLVASYFILGEKIGPLGYCGFFLILFGLWFGDYLQARSERAAIRNS